MPFGLTKSKRYYQKSLKNLMTTAVKMGDFPTQQPPNGTCTIGAQPKLMSLSLKSATHSLELDDPPDGGWRAWRVLLVSRAGRLGRLVVSNSARPANQLPSSRQGCFIYGCAMLVSCVRQPAWAPASQLLLIGCCCVAGLWQCVGCVFRYVSRHDPHKIVKHTQCFVRRPRSLLSQEPLFGDLDHDSAACRWPVQFRMLKHSISLPRRICGAHCRSISEHECRIFCWRAPR